MKLLYQVLVDIHDADLPDVMVEALITLLEEDGKKPEVIEVKLTDVVAFAT